MNNKYYIIGGIILLAGTFAFGRYSAPERVRIETKTVTVEVEKKTQNTDIKQNTKTTTVIKPDGTKIIDTTTISDTDTKTKTDIDQTTSTDTTKETDKSSSKLIIEGLASTTITNPSGITFGGHISNNLIGPVRIGVFGFTDGKVGISLGFQF